MSTSIALLRGINVSGKNKIRMADLKALFESLGCTSVVTYLQSGNVVFENSTNIDAQVIEQAIENTFQLQVPVLVVSVETWEKVSQSNTFLQNETADPAHCYLTCLWKEPDPGMLSGLEVPAKESGRFQVDGAYVYVHCPEGYGRTKIHTGFFEKELHCLATTRNWKTVKALLELSQAL